MSAVGPPSQRWHYWDEVALVVLFVIAFVLPWARFGAGGEHTILWLRLPALLQARGAASFDNATITVTCIALVFACMAAGLRLWSALSSCGEASGTQKYQQRARLAALWLFGAAISILLPAWGAAVFLVSLLLCCAFLAAGLTRGDAARRLPNGSLSSVATPSEPFRNGARWPPAVAQESFYLAFAVCMAVFVWRYNPALLLRALVFCLGGSLVLRALLPAGSRL